MGHSLTGPVGTVVPDFTSSEEYEITTHTPSNHVFFLKKLEEFTNVTKRKKR